ncbi:MAG: aconitate hydratase AcnA [Anaeromyxobacter sp.]|nr:aconitate hydratase AcnA [Anaeromyxobacter sp.]MBL0275736.1 aconitate hydratase AcnA [Anaeromyxobacter sp.]
MGPHPGCSSDAAPQHPRRGGPAARPRLHLGLPSPRQEPSVRDHLGLTLPFDVGSGRTGRLVSLPELERRGFGPVSRLPVSLRVVLESLARNADGQRVTEEDVRALAGWRPNAERTREVPFVVARVLLQDFTGVPLLVDLAAMRAAAARLGRAPGRIEPIVPVDLVVDHSVQVDAWGTSLALTANMDLEFARNLQRYRFLKWGTQAFSTFRIVPPGFGICHQVNLEHLARGVFEQGGLWYPDTLVGTDSHTTMINGLGIVGWGVGGIEAEAAMLGQPSAFLTPDVVGLHLSGAVAEGVTATDLVLTVTELLRAAKVVGKFVEFFGEGAASLTAATRATLANMAPEYGATMGFFPTDEKTLEYLAATGRSAAQVAAVRAYYQAQGLFGIPREGEVDYTQVLRLDLSTVEPSVAGPKRPQDRVALSSLKRRFLALFEQPAPEGFGKEEAGLSVRHPASAPAPTPASAAAPAAPAVPGLRAVPTASLSLRHGDVVIAAITSCTNTSNPSVMLAAGLLARKARARGLHPAPWVKTSLAPGSRVVSDYLANTGLQADLDALGFQVVGYGCTTCIGNSGPLDPRLEALIGGQDLVVASVLSGNRNFEARVHPAVKANFLMSPPLVVAFALAGRVDIDLASEPLGRDARGAPVFLADVWPSAAEVDALLLQATRPEVYQATYADLAGANPAWKALEAPTGAVPDWDAGSTYIAEAPWFEGFDLTPGATSGIQGARALAILGDSVTTDHISPAGTIAATSPAGRWLTGRGVAYADYNSYGARRGHHEVMVRGTFANVRLKNLMVPGVEGGVTAHQPSGERLAIFDAAERYRAEGTPLLVIAGQEYGTGSSRDWAAKGTRLLGVRMVVARSFERIHRANLVGMGVLPLQLADGVSALTLGLDGTETYDLPGAEGPLVPRQRLALRVTRRGGAVEDVPVTLRVDTPVEVEYLRHGGILPYVLRQLM